MSTCLGRRTLMSRRAFVQAGAVGTGALLLACTERVAPLPRAPGASEAGFGDLVRDGGGVLDLPKGFQYRIISEEGSQLSNGAPVPGAHDAMAAFRGRGGVTILVRNHELGGDEGPAVEGDNPYDDDSPGGTTAVVVGPDRNEIESYVTSSGTVDNCAGGSTPWGTWLTCEETLDQDHGHVFEVMPEDRENDLSRAPIEGMGLFSHEAAAVDPASGIVYLTEDEGPVSFLFRYIPEDPSPAPGALQGGGTLQAFAIVEESAADADSFKAGQRFRERWIDVDPERAHDDADEQDAVRFTRLEGAYFAGGALWFNDTEGGEDGLGQTYRYIPASETLELFFESSDANDMKSPDNTVIAPWGDLLFAEDASDGNRVMGITPGGELYVFAFNRLNDSEFAGPCFTPDAQTMFLNMQVPGKTFAIWGPFSQRSAFRQRRMATAQPPPAVAPVVSGEIAEVARRYGMSHLEALAFARLGVPLLG
jgi:secreted PhoX family phosphatase